MDKLIVADVQAHVGGPLAGIALLEDDDITGLQLISGDGRAVVQLVGGGAVELIAELFVHVAGKAGAVEAAGGGPAIYIAVTQELEGVVGDLLTLGGVLGLGGIHLTHIVAADVAGINLIPAVQDIRHLNYLAHRQLAHPVIVGAGAGADIQGTLEDLDVHRFCGLVAGLSGLGSRRGGGGDGLVLHLVLSDGEVVGGDVAGGALIGDLIPAGHGLVQHVYLRAMGQLGEDGAVGAGLRAEPEAAALGIDSAGGGQGRGDQRGSQQQAGGKAGSGALEVHINVLLFLSRRLISGTVSNCNFCYFPDSARSSQTAATSIAA